MLQGQLILRQQCRLSKLKVTPVAFTVLFIQTEDVKAEKENKNLKVVERFHVERELKQGSLCVELEGTGMMHPSLYL